MADDYYMRQGAAHLDGTRIFQSTEDRTAETSVAALLEARWDCSIRSFGALSPIDWYAERHGRLIGLVELKTRQHPRERFRTVFLNVRKWLTLSVGAVGLGVPAVFVVKFTDGLFWTPLARIDASRHLIGGCMRIVKSVNDIEPVIEVDVNALHEVRGK